MKNNYAIIIRTAKILGACYLLKEICNKTQLNSMASRKEIYMKIMPVA